MWPQLIFFVISLIISYALRPKPEQAKPASLQDVNVPTADEGRPIPVIFGTVTIKGPNVLWYGDFGSTAIKK